ncbi:MAG: hypothetical protein HZA50_17250 [Planctomycetes bacterium]|nr:hypothetical protein [Planctomycetota bacterium]
MRTSFGRLLWRVAEGFVRFAAMGSTVNMKQKIIRLLKRMASREYQERYCVSGTKSEYVLPLEMYEETVYAINHAISSKEMKKNFPAEDISALKEFMEMMKEQDRNIPSEDSKMSNIELIRECPAWSMVRCSAEQCLRKLGCNDDLADVND